MIKDNSAKSTDFNNDSNIPNFEDFISSFKSSSSKNSEAHECVDDYSNPFSNIDMNTIFKIKQAMDSMNNTKNNPRSNLLLSLKPYLRPERRPKIDQYIQLFNMSNIVENFKSMGSEK